MAHKKGQSSTRNGRDSNAQHRGIKHYGGELVKAGAIIVRQCGQNSNLAQMLDAARITHYLPR